MTTDRLDLPTECAECGNVYAERDLQFGICDSCDNESRGLCACGSYPGPNRRQCRSCAAEDHADALFHADR